ncbi:polysaccharide biosynthesis tyrosine autokinase [Actinotalea fermentans]|uniref:non-specific protein-tyrosine kinase n=1 Tax=Actinotalea fermentans TaxID=43671 RepID=A0A511Z1H1_9CELL|nr:polysaccharide biosynthesis tyrosine autokinase [Actinotalea fermentans]KGM17069.1 chromosome partitioning protein [Actinotalea fermentans ATCC 43279 = JCM 9966 = DSM 3133]GEN81292.1 chromosome partitioning protein [Actinotalea fermentans]
MELRDYLAIVRKRWISIALITVLLTGAAVAVTLATTPVYTARAQVYVSVRTGETTTDLLQGSSFSQRQVKSYTDLASTPLVLTPVIEHLDLATTPDTLAESVSADSPLDTSLINIRASDPDPQTASDIANAVAESLAEQVTALEEPDEGPSPVEINTVRTASAPTEPSSPNLKLNVALGLLLGLAAGFGLAILREVLDTRVRTVDDVRSVTTASILTSMAHDEESVGKSLVVQTDPHSPRAEAFRRLRTNLQFLDVAERLSAIVVTSSLPTEGKSTVAVNLAITLSDAGSRVVIVDADLRRPSVAEYMGVEGSVGLTTVLIGKASIEDVVQPWGTGNLHVLPSGQVPPNPSEMVGSAAMAWLINELTKRYDLVIIDTPPLLPVTDAAILARLVDGALVVTGANRLHRHELADAMGSLEAVGARVLGVVVNHLARKHGEGYSYHYYGSDENAPRQRRGARRPAPKARSSRAAGHANAPVTRLTPPPSATPPRVTTRHTPEAAPQPQPTGSFDALLQTEPDEVRPGRWPGGPIA